MTCQRGKYMMRATEFVRPDVPPFRTHPPRCEGSNRQRGSVRKYLATVRVGGQSVKTVVVTDSAAHAALLLRYHYGAKNVITGPAKIDETEHLWAARDPGLPPVQEANRMRYRELTTPELEHRLEKIIADQHYNQLTSNRVLQNAVKQGIERAHSHYVAQLMPGRETRQRKMIRHRQREAERERNRLERSANVA